MSTYTEDKRKVTTRRLLEMKQRGEKISMLTAYDFSMAKLIDEAGMDVILVGDSASNVMAGNVTTLPMTLDQMIYHGKSVMRGVNRALVVERRTAEKYGLEIVCAVPRPKAGGSLATAAYRRMENPVLVERIEADAGLDVGLTLIGMHLRRVAVPVRLSTQKIGCATVTAARTRPKLIGGERAKYTVED